MYRYVKRKVAGLKSKIRQKGVILMYHRIIDIQNDPWDLAVSPVNFEQQLQVLKKNKLGIPLYKFHNLLKKGKIGHNSLAITFDDGYKDNFENALPLLSKYNMPATFFIATANLNVKREFWWDELERLIFFSAELPHEFLIIIQNEIFSWNITSDNIWRKNDQIKHLLWKGADIPPTQRHKLFFEIWKTLKFRDYYVQLEILDKIKSLIPSKVVDRKENFAMGTSEISILNKNSLFEIGAHTVHHPSLPSLNKSAQMEEIRKSIEILQAIIKEPVNAFAYPYGDYDKITMECTKNSGLIYACSTEEKPVFNKQNPYCLPRFQVKNWNGKDFEKQLKLWFNRLFQTI